MALREYFTLLTNSALFRGVEADSLSGMLGCLGAQTTAYSKGEAVFLAGNPARRVGLVLEGQVQVVRDDVLGNRTILTQLNPGGLFGETFACAGVETLPVSALATAPSKVLLLDYRRIITTCASTCVFHSRLIENMLQILAEKNLLLNQKIEALSARTTREKLLAYLSVQASRAGSSSFQIPYNRQELADYLSVDRSALSREMGAMQREGLITYHKSRFTLLG